LTTGAAHVTINLQTGPCRRKDEKMNEYRYSDLRAAALADPTAENLAALGEWLQEYGGRGRDG